MQSDFEPMTGREAGETLDVIRTLMERGTHYRNLSGHAGVAAGCVALIGAAARAWLKTPFSLTWGLVFTLAMSAAVFYTARMARENGEVFWTRQARTIVLALTPAFFAAVVLSYVLDAVGQRGMLPGIWMLMWGVGALAMSFFTPRVIWMLGSAFLACGAATLLAGLQDDALTMGLTFGAIHLLYGVILTVFRPVSAGGAVFRDA